MELFVICFVIGWFASASMVGSLLATVTASGLAVMGGIAAFVLVGILLYGIARESKVAFGVFCFWILFLTWMFAMAMAPEIGLGLALAIAIVCAIFWFVGVLMVVKFIQEQLLS